MITKESEIEFMIGMCKELIVIRKENAELKEQKQLLIEDSERLYILASNTYDFIAGVQYSEAGAYCREYCKSLAQHSALMDMVKDV